MNETFMEIHSVRVSHHSLVQLNEAEWFQRGLVGLMGGACRVLWH